MKGMATNAENVHQVSALFLYQVQYNLELLHDDLQAKR